MNDYFYDGQRAIRQIMLGEIYGLVHFVVENRGDVYNDVYGVDNDDYLTSRLDEILGYYQDRTRTPLRLKGQTRVTYAQAFVFGRLKSELIECGLNMVDVMEDFTNEDFLRMSVVDAPGVLDMMRAVIHMDTPPPALMASKVRSRRPL
jgi:hypothetical protein